MLLLLASRVGCDQCYDDGLSGFQKLYNAVYNTKKILALTSMEIIVLYAVWFLPVFFPLKSIILKVMLVVLSKDSAF